MKLFTKQRKSNLKKRKNWLRNQQGKIVEYYLPSGCKVTDTLTDLHCLPCCKLIAFMASLSGNIGNVAVGRKIEVPLCIASLWTINRISNK